MAMRMGGRGIDEADARRAADPRRRRANARHGLALFRPCRLGLSAVLALIAISAGLDLISPFLLRDVLDTAIPDQNEALLTALVGGMVLIAVVNGVLGVFQTLLSNQVGQRV